MILGTLAAASSPVIVCCLKHRSTGWAPLLGIFCKHSGPGFSNLQGSPERRSTDEAPFVPAATNHGAKSISSQTALSWQQSRLIAFLRLCDVAGCLHSRGKSLFAPQLWPHSSRARACLSLITREMVQGKSLEMQRKGCAEVTQGGDQLWLMLFTFEEKEHFGAGIACWLASKGHKRERMPFLFSTVRDHAMQLKETANINNAWGPGADTVFNYLGNWGVVKLWL